MGTHTTYVFMEKSTFWLSYKMSTHNSAPLGFEGREVLCRVLFAWSYKHEGTVCHEMCLVSGYVT